MNGVTGSITSLCSLSSLFGSVLSKSITILTMVLFIIGKLILLMSVFIIACYLLMKKLSIQKNDKFLYPIGYEGLSSGYQAQYNSRELEEFIKNGGVYGNKAPIHNSNDYHR